MTSENELPTEIVEWLGSVGHGRLAKADRRPGGARGPPGATLFPGAARGPCDT